LILQSQPKNLVAELSVFPNDYVYYKKLIRKIAGPTYVFTDEIKDVWNMLFLYFIGSSEVEKYGISLNKSIALTGTYGIGKSTIFRIIHKWLEMIQFRNSNTFRISSTEEIINIFQQKDWIDNVVLLNMTENIAGVRIPKPIHVLINEFGYMYDVKSYGTNVQEYIEIFIMKRYDIFQEYGKLTHLTTNFSVDQLKNNFPPRIFDRFREMFNLIELKGASFRK
jgi:hypothetical protein